jgi:hypothetical protein
MEWARDQGQVVAALEEKVEDTAEWRRRVEELEAEVAALKSLPCSH